MRFGFGQVGLSMESVYLELLVCGLAFGKSVWELVSRCIWSYWFAVWLSTSRFGSWSVGVFGAIGLRFGFGQVGLSMESVYLELLVCGLALNKPVCQWSRCIWSYWFAVWLWTGRFGSWSVGVFGAIGLRFGVGQVGLSMESVYLELLVCGLALDKSVCQWSRCIWSYWFAVWLWTSRFGSWSVGVFRAIGLRFGFGQVGLLQSFQSDSVTSRTLKGTVHQRSPFKMMVELVERQVLLLCGALE